MATDLKIIQRIIQTLVERFYYTRNTKSANDRAHNLAHVLGVIPDLQHNQALSNEKGLNDCEIRQIMDKVQRSSKSVY